MPFVKLDIKYMLKLMLVMAVVLVIKNIKKLVL